MDVAEGNHPPITRRVSAVRRVLIAFVMVVALHLAVVAYLCFSVVSPKPVVPKPMAISILLPESLPMVQPAEPVKPKPRVIPPKPEPVVQPVPKVVATRPTIEAPVPVEQKVEPASVAAAPVKEAPPVVEPTQPRFDVEGLQNPALVYPPLSRRVGEAGKVMLRVYVTADGQAGEVQLFTSSGFSRLDKAAMATVEKWHFKPAQLGNDKIAAWVHVPIIFKLEN